MYIANLLLLLQYLNKIAYSIDILFLRLDCYCVLNKDNIRKLFTRLPIPKY